MRGVVVWGMDVTIIECFSTGDDESLITHPLTYTIFHPCTYPLTHTITHPGTHLRTYPLTFSHTPLIQTLTYPLINFVSPIAPFLSSIPEVTTAQHALTVTLQHVIWTTLAQHTPLDATRDADASIEALEQRLLRVLWQVHPYFGTPNFLLGTSFL